LKRLVSPRRGLILSSLRVPIRWCSR
jgi:hypothetical protein